MPFETVLSEIREHTTIITFNRPHRLNALIPQLETEAAEALRQAEADPQVRAVIITGAGRAFCAGMDMKAAAEAPAETRERPRPVDPQAARLRLHVLVRDVTKPVIAAVNGPARGAGCNVIWGADFRIAGESADFALNFTERGLVGAASGTYIQQLVGRHIATRIMMLGETFDARQAEAWGLIHEVTPDDQLLETAMRWAARLARQQPLALRYTKLLMNRGLHEPLINVWEAQIAANAILRQTEDYQEGLRAFAERREPNYKGF